MRYKINKASAGSELTYRQAPERQNLDDSLEAVERRKEIRERMQQMLSVARENVQDELDDARKNGDAESVAELEAMMNKLAPLPEGISLSTSSPPDYQRWLDPENLR